MPRKKKLEEGNVVQFPTAQNEQAVPTAELEEKAQKGASKVLEIIDRNRKDGLTKLEKCVDNYSSREMISGENAKPFNEGMLRDLEQGIAAGFLALEGLNNLVEMIRHDLVGMIQNVEGLSVANWQSSAHLQTLLSVLKEKGVVNENELKEMWEKIVPAQMAKTAEQMKAEQATKPESSE